MQQTWPMYKDSLAGQKGNSFQPQEEVMGPSAKAMRERVSACPIQLARKAVAARDIVMSIEGRCSSMPATSATSDQSQLGAAPSQGVIAAACLEALHVPEVTAQSSAIDNGVELSAQLQVRGRAAPEDLLTDLQPEQADTCEQSGTTKPVSASDEASSAEQNQDFGHAATRQLPAVTSPYMPDQAAEEYLAGSSADMAHPTDGKTQEHTSKSFGRQHTEKIQVPSKQGHHFTVQKACQPWTERAEDTGAGSVSCAANEHERKVDAEDEEMLSALKQLAGCSPEGVVEGNARSPDALSRSSVLWILRDLLLLLPHDSDYT